MSSSFDFIWATLEGKNKYKCLLSPDLRIIYVEPENAYLLYRDLQDVYSVHKGKFDIKNLELAGTPMLLDSDRFEHMSKKNPSLVYLAKKFNCKAL